MADPTVAERWLPVVRYEGIYSVSSLGRMRSERKSTNSKPGMILLGHTSGYRRLALRKGGVSKTQLVHRLVAEAFLGPSPVGYEVNHINGVKHDNAVANLEWVTKSANAIHAHLVLGHKTPCGCRGADNHAATLNIRQVRIIRRCLLLRIRGKDVAEVFGVKEMVVSNIKRRVTWNYSEALVD